MNNIKATIFNMQKFSLHDGPGIRTVIFFKGCPLHCPWCSNPESQAKETQILWDEEKCVRCQTCVQNCPQKAISFTDDRIQIDTSLCVGCQTCVQNCPAKALSAEGEEKNLEEVLAFCMQDFDFYEESGGGVTLSGGEVLTHPEFATKLLKALKEKGSHTALETTGFARAEVFERLLPYVDLLLFDCKHHNSKKHQEVTGVPTEQIHANMRTALAKGVPVIARIPVIPGFNDQLEDAHAFCSLLRDLGVQDVNLLPFHQFGENKYRLLGKTYAYENTPAYHPEDLKEYQDIFLQNDFNCICD